MGGEEFGLCDSADEGDAGLGTRILEAYMHTRKTVDSGETLPTAGFDVEAGITASRRVIGGD